MVMESIDRLARYRVVKPTCIEQAHHPGYGGAPPLSTSPPYPVEDRVLRGHTGRVGVGKITPPTSMAHPLPSFVLQHHLNDV